MTKAMLLRHQKVKTPRLCLVIVIAILCLSACSESKSKSYSAKTIKKCEKWEASKCRKSCSKGAFRECYRSTKNKSAVKDVSWQCYAVHVGSTCKPCKDMFALNFAGALKEVSCEEYYTAIDKKNARCGNCLRKIRK